MMNVFEGWNYLYLKVFSAEKKYSSVTETCSASAWNFSEHPCAPD